jgi:hypothetical protein
MKGMSIFGGPDLVSRILGELMGWVGGLVVGKAFGKLLLVEMIAL